MSMSIYLKKRVIVNLPQRIYRLFGPKAFGKNGGGLFQFKSYKNISNLIEMGSLEEFYS